MKKQNGLCSVLMNIPKTLSWTFKNISNNVGKAFYLTFISSFLLASAAVAQPASNSTSQKGPDITSSFKSKKESKTMKRELRQEKESTKAVENIPQTVFDHFNSQFPKATDVEWSVPDDEYSEADFTLNNKSKIANYDFSGKLVGVGTFMDYNQIPVKGRNQIDKAYKGYTPVQTMFYDDNENNDTNATLFGTPIVKDAYFVQMKKGSDRIVLQIDRDGEVSYFAKG